jgi:hypothetical protein
VSKMTVKSKRIFYLIMMAHFYGPNDDADLLSNYFAPSVKMEYVELSRTPALCAVLFPYRKCTMRREWGQEDGEC